MRPGGKIGSKLQLKDCIEMREVYVNACGEVIGTVSITEARKNKIT